MPEKDELTERLLAQEEDYKANPVDWHYTMVCQQCGNETIASISKGEILKYRKQHGLPNGAAVSIKVASCLRCESSEDEGEVIDG